MKTKMLFAILFIFFGLNINAQIITFQEAFGGSGVDWANSVQQTSDGGYIIIGYTNSFGAGNKDIYLVKMNVNGDTLWTKTYGGTGDDEGNSVQQTSDGGYIIVGYTNSFGAGGYDVYLIKVNINGDSLWTKTFGGAGDDYANSVCQTSDGGYIITGSGLFGSGGGDIYLIKTDTVGNIQWNKTYGSVAYYIDWGYSVKQTTDGGYIISGFYLGVNADVWLIKTASNGNILWSRTFGGAASEIGASCQQTSDGGYIVAGSTNSFGAGNNDVYLIKTDMNGDTLWTKTYGNTGDDKGYSVQQTTDGGFIIAGYYIISSGVSDVYLIKTDGNGNLSWSKTFGGANGEFGYSVQQTLDGGYILVGMTQSFGAGNSDIYVIKTDSNGNSGCNQTNPVTIVNSPASTNWSSGPLIGSGGTLGNTSSIVSEGGSPTSVCSTVGTQTLISSIGEINIYPNPSSGKFILDSKITQGEISIYNAIGEKVFISTIQQLTDARIDLSDQPNGIYLVNLKTEKENLIEKIIISN
jgi:hypothetical protein